MATREWLPMAVIITIIIALLFIFTPALKREEARLEKLSPEERCIEEHGDDYLKNIPANCLKYFGVNPFMQSE